MDASPRWFACYTRARAEKRVRDLLADRGVECYLPLIEQERVWSDRIKRIEFPLFPSYVFARFAWPDASVVLSVPGVSTIVKLAGQPAAIPDGEIENVRRFVAALSNGQLDTKPRDYFQEGQRVRVVGGAFDGVEGVVVERRGRCRLLVGLTAIRQGFEVDVSADRLEAV